MLDRVPLYPGRVKLTPVSGQENVYDMVRADQPTQEGTPLNKENLLTDAVANLIGLTPAAVPNDMFNVLAHAGDLYVWKRSIIGYEPTLSTTEYTLDGSTATGPSGVTKYSKTVTVVDGSVVLSGDITTIIGPISADEAAKMVGSYFTLISSTVNYAKSSNGTIITFQITTGYKNADIVDYPVSTKPDAYTPVTSVTAGDITIEYMGQVGDKIAHVCGLYTGTGSTSGRFIDVGFTPSAVLIVYESYRFSDSSIISSLFVNNFPSEPAYGIVENGFKVGIGGSSLQLDSNGIRYNYVAFK